MADESVSNGALARRKNLMSVFLCLTMRARQSGAERAARCVDPQSLTVD